MKSIENRVNKLEEQTAYKTFVPVAIIGPDDPLPDGITEESVIIIDDIGTDDETGETDGNGEG